MKLKNVVKVMNFHSLLRVDSSRRTAKKYAAMESVLIEMIDNIVNNRNIVLDVSVLRVPKDRPVLNIYIGSDLGFCSNINSLVNNELNSDVDGDKVIIGRKIGRYSKKDNTIMMSMSREDFAEDHTSLLGEMEKAIKELKYSQINLVYNHYYNSSEVEFKKKTIFPLPKHFSEKTTYAEDFSYEGDIEDLLVNLVILYLQYELEIAANVSYAAENITRQNVTTESLKKIDEREEIEHRKEVRETKDKQFAKVLDNYTKLNSY